MGASAFDLVWQKIAALEGAVFQTAQGVAFRYRFQKTYVVVSSGNQSIPRTYFEKIHQRLERGNASSTHLLQGQSFILAILTDPRCGG